MVEPDDQLPYVLALSLLLIAIVATVIVVIGRVGSDTNEAEVEHHVKRVWVDHEPVCTTLRGIGGHRPCINCKGNDDISMTVCGTFIVK